MRNHWFSWHQLYFKTKQRNNAPSSWPVAHQPEAALWGTRAQVVAGTNSETGLQLPGLQWRPASPRNSVRKAEGRGGPSCLPAVQALLPWGWLESCLVESHSCAEQQRQALGTESPLPPVAITARSALLWNRAGQLINAISHKEMVPVGKMDLGELSVFVPCAVLCHKTVSVWLRMTSVNPSCPGVSWLSCCSALTPFAFSELQQLATERTY